LASPAVIFTEDAYLEKTSEASILYLFNAGCHNHIVGMQRGVPKGSQNEKKEKSMDL
jgi:hypothetical protein